MDYDLKNILVIDIETISCVEEYGLLEERLQKQWDKKSSTFKDADLKSSSELFGEKAGIYAEFGKVVTIAVGFYILDEENDTVGLRIKAFAGHDEALVLNDFKNLLETKFDQEKLLLCAHNGKEFDFPYLCRRMLVNGITIPSILDIGGKKPWEVKHIDTMELWKFGDRKSYTSLELLASLFNVSSSKDQIDGSMVTSVYYKEKDLLSIAKYCMEDVAVTSQIFLKLNNKHNFDTQNINYLPITL
jgi:predicted PolB exonuclease-like 3'-5' exonuclease